MAELVNKRHEMFAQEYLIDMCQTRAAIRTGYSPLAARKYGYRLMKIPRIRARVDELLAERSRRTGVNQDRVVWELARIAFLDPMRLIDADTGKMNPDASEDDRAAIAEIRVKTAPLADGESVETTVRFAGKLKALELLGKHLGIFGRNGSEEDARKLELLRETFRSVGAEGTPKQEDWDNRDEGRTAVADA